MAQISLGDWSADQRSGGQDSRTHYIYGSWRNRSLCQGQPFRLVCTMCAEPAAPDGTKRGRQIHVLKDLRTVLFTDVSALADSRPISRGGRHHVVTFVENSWAMIKLLGEIVELNLLSQGDGRIDLVDHSCRRTCYCVGSQCRAALHQHSLLSAVSHQLSRGVGRSEQR